MNFKKGDKVCLDLDLHVGGAMPLIIKSETPMLFLQSDGKMAECMIASMSAPAGIKIFINHNRLRLCEKPSEVDVEDLMKMLEV